MKLAIIYNFYFFIKKLPIKEVLHFFHIFSLFQTFLFYYDKINYNKYVVDINECRFLSLVNFVYISSNI